MSQAQTAGRTLGADVRALRKARGMTLIALSLKLDRSVGWLSQVERDISAPTDSDLAEIAAVLDISVTSLQQAQSTPQEAGVIVRADARRPIGNRTPGLTEALLSPDLTDDFEVIHSRFDPGAKITKSVQRQTQEIGYVLTGIFDIWVDDTYFRLNPGDSFRLRGETLRWANPGKAPCDVIWIISPPVY